MRRWVGWWFWSWSEGEDAGVGTFLKAAVINAKEINCFHLPRVCVLCEAGPTYTLSSEPADKTTNTPVPHLAVSVVCDSRPQRHSTWYQRSVITVACRRDVRVYYLWKHVTAGACCRRLCARHMLHIHFYYQWTTIKKRTFQRCW